MTEWITSWASIAHYLDVCVRTAQYMAKERVIIVYKTKRGRVRADPKELDKHLKSSIA